MPLNAGQIARLWVRQGGNPNYARLMARIALRESSGNPRINNRGLNSNGTTDWGLFQVNDVWRKDPVVGPLFRSGAILTPKGATQAAIHILKSQGPSAWSTYNPATDKRFLGGFKGFTGGSGATGGGRASGRLAGPSGVESTAAARSLLAQVSSTAARPAVAGIAAPAFSASVKLPDAYGGSSAASSGGTPSGASSVQSLLAAARGMSAGGVPNVGGAAGAAAKGNRDLATHGSQFQQALGRAMHINSQHLPYSWGGGHGADARKDGAPLDCSGAVSKVLGIDPRVSGQFTSWGRPGRGGNVIVAANSEHVLMAMRFNGKWHWFGTSHQNPGGGAGWIPSTYFSPGYFKNFQIRHATI